MPARSIVQGQKVTESKTIRARQFRREMTPAEQVLWAKLRRNQLGGFHFRRHQIIDGFIADFFCNAAGLVVEVDGPVHQGQIEYGTDRDRILAARNLRILRISNDAVFRDLPSVLEQIAAALRSSESTSAVLQPE